MAQKIHEELADTLILSFSQLASLVQIFGEATPRQTQSAAEQTRPEANYVDVPKKKLNFKNISKFIRDI